ncbi:MAG: peptidoglycan-binding protein [Alphaproteobacteria bacterium]|nr:peptidoglycan-binding protein [Alphaproteobacteria bacterium]
MTSAATNVNWAGAAGNAALTFCGRLVGHGFVWAFRHPLSSGMALMLSFGIGMGAINALFLQTAPHPAPLFIETASIARPEPAHSAVSAAQPIPMPVSRPIERVVETIAAPAQVSMPGSVGNKDVAELQARLSALGFFAGKIDGYYGPKTADAIRRFEGEAGLTPVGAVTPEVIAAAKTFAPRNITQPVPRSEPEPVVVASPAVPVADDPIGRIAAAAAAEPVVVAAAPPATPAPDVAVTRTPTYDAELVRMVQTGLSRLGFLHAEISGSFDAETARAIREFENYNNFRVTGELTPDLVDVLMAAGAFN